MNSRFTIDGSDELENHLEQTCRQVATGVREIVPRTRLRALLLGGGYGRGQGGVLKTTSGDKPYNDLEFYVCLDGNELLNQRKFNRALHTLAETLSHSAGVEVEFKITSLKKLQAIPPTMFTYDLAAGHRALLGKDDFFADCSSWKPGEIPMFEATRLLMNRCSGLLFAKERLRRKPFTAEDADFVGRNHAKAQLAFGDVFLTAHHLYHWDCRERNTRLKTIRPEHNLLWLDDVRRHHSEGLEFKLHPFKTMRSMDLLCDQQRELTHLGFKIWLWLESVRLKTTFNSATDYAFSRQNKCPETNALRNFLINGKTFRLAMFGRNPFSYPRQRLLHSLALLLWEPASLTREKPLRQLQGELQTSATTFPQFVKSYETLWRRFN